jgi:anhydro-N-acetylmuramic acid kinase
MKISTPSPRAASARLVAGLMSGTSLDGIDAVLVRMSGSGLSTRFRQLAHVHVAYPPELRRILLRNSRPETSRVDDIARLNMVLAIRYADAVRKLARRAGIARRRIDLIGSHGQTIHHLPVPAEFAGTRTGATLQIGDPSAVATLTGITTAGNFRTADMAVGGGGAPLVPYFDWLMFRSRNRTRALLNLGGIANITILPRRCTAGEVIAFDTGPGNMIIDGLMRALFGRTMDVGGRVGRRGMVIHEVLAWMKRHPYLRRRPPKSTGREQFGEEFLRRLLERGRHHDPADLIATAAEFTAWTVADACKRYGGGRRGPDELIVSGGGARNAAVMAALARYFEDSDVGPIENYGIASEAKEAICFAVLANETVHGRPANLPRVTGARSRVVLGCVCTPSATTE